MVPQASRARWRARFTLLCGVVLWLAVILPTRADSAPVSSGGTTNVGAFHSGNFRNLFAEIGHSHTAIRQKLDRGFQHLFMGDPRTEAVYYAAGSNTNGPLAYILDIHNNDVRSEGMSYGMMIAVQLGRKREFDALWNWSKSFMYHSRSNHPARGYFAWSIRTNGVANDEMPAPDGEEYFATALFFASHRWNDGKGIYNYKAEANQLLHDFLHRETISGRTISGVQTGVNLFDVEHAMVRFTPDFPNRNHTDPSYHLPGFYELWALWGPDRDRAFWARAASVSRDFFERSAHPQTGLTPDYANFDGTPWRANWNPGSEHFQFDAWRCAMNWSFDWAWWARDERAQRRSDRLQSFFERQGIGRYASRYTLSGEPRGSEHNLGLVAMNAVASLAATDPRARRFVEELWNAEPPSGSYRYYDGMLYLLALLHCSGEFKIWKP